MIIYGSDALGGELVFTRYKRAVIDLPFLQL